MLVVDTTQATASNRVKYYVNGTQITAFATTDYPTQNSTTTINSAVAHNIGAYTSSTQYLDGYLTEVNFIDGQALTPTSFGQFNSVTGVWQPLKYTGTYGTNGFYLNFSDNSTATAAAIGKDLSGNGNNWTPNNISVTAGATYDSMLDVPTPWADGGNGRGNYAVLNPLRQNGSATFAQGNLAGTSESGTSRGLCSTIVLPRSDKWYMEWTPSSSTTNWFGVTANDILAADINTAGQQSVLYYANGTKWVNGSNSAYGSSYTTQTIGIAFDGPAGTVTFYRDNVSQGAISLPSSTVDYVFCMGNAGGGGVTNYANFGQRPFTYTPPTGFKALNTQNLPDSTIKKGNQYFDVSLWTGDQTSRTITNSGAFQPDFIWTKSRSDAESHRLHDAVRGGNGSVLYELNSNETSAEGTDTLVSGFASNGFTIASGANSPNVTGRTYVGWQWKEGATPGFDIVTYTGDGTTNRTVAHSLGVTPAMVIVKARSGAENWAVYHRSLSTGNFLFLNTTNAVQSPDGTFNSSTPVSSTQVQFGSPLSSRTNGNGVPFVMYLFSEVAGFSRMGSYQGNGSSDGSFVYCGFRPRWVMTKRTDSVGSWLVVDSARNSYNVVNGYLVPNTSDAEGSATWGDFTANGFKLRGTTHNGSGESYIFAAFAENPFKNALAR